MAQIIAPDVKSGSSAGLPSLPGILIIIPVLLYIWLGWTAINLGKDFYEVRSLKAIYPREVAERQQLESTTSTHRDVIAEAEAQFEAFRKWKGWITESPALSPAIAAILNSIQGDVRVNTVSITKSMEAPNQLKLLLRVALTTTEPAKQFEMTLNALDAVGWKIGGSVEQGSDADAAQKFPTPAGIPREIFYKLEATLVEKVDFTAPVVPIDDSRKK